ncbi:MAG: 50S ribosomal protein L23 [Oligoflexia bacterium]|nr:50S ribosomal protein L23 [Oligoflexia bacterium]
MIRIEDVLVKPLLTEKLSVCAERDNRFGFQVLLKANKNQIKKAVEKLFDVKVINVKTVILPGRAKRVKRSVFKTPSIKKAYVRVKDGQKIELFKGI